jgi:hypothetical protein
LGGLMGPVAVTCRAYGRDLNLLDLPIRSSEGRWQLKIRRSVAWLRRAGSVYPAMAGPTEFRGLPRRD